MASLEARQGSSTLCTDLVFIFIFLVGQVFYPHHSNQMSQRSNFIESLFEVVLKMSLYSSFSKKIRPVDEGTLCLGRCE